MNLQFEAARELHAFFSSHNIHYCIIGRIALQHWGEPRFTQDVDATVLIAFGEEDKLLEKIFSAFKPRITDAFDFTLWGGRESRVRSSTINYIPDQICNSFVFFKIPLRPFGQLCHSKKSQIYFFLL